MPLLSNAQKIYDLLQFSLDYFEFQWEASLTRWIPIKPHLWQNTNEIFPISKAKSYFLVGQVFELERQQLLRKRSDSPSMTAFVGRLDEDSLTENLFVFFSVKNYEGSWIDWADHEGLPKEWRRIAGSVWSRDASFLCYFWQINNLIFKIKFHWIFLFEKKNNESKNTAKPTRSSIGVAICLLCQTQHFMAVIEFSIEISVYTQTAGDLFCANKNFLLIFFRVSFLFVCQNSSNKTIRVPIHWPSNGRSGRFQITG